MVADLLRLLEESRQEWKEAVAGLSEAQAAEAPAGGGWCVLQCVEHVVIVERRSRQRLVSAERRETPAPNRTEFVTAALAGRERRVQAPEAVRPAGRFSTLAQALEAFDREREATAGAVAAMGDDLLYRTAEHPFFGTLNGHDLIAALAGHTRRHAAQVRELRGVTRFPA